jgi:Zn-finger nucleic acid-binding protein
MKCPRCENTVLDERDRDGITVDVCASCRGLWLDRGELEKLIARAARELEELSPQSSPQPLQPVAQPMAAQSRPQSNPLPPPEARRMEPEHYRERRDSTPPHGVRYDRERDAYDRDRRHHYGRHKKKSFLDILGDVFD